ncbi:hypothetical protein GCM10022224_058160 [Nonomuraea antimicrobica]|uniref:Tissue inhibitor of metalloproteinase n=1 Tax=Nonomuraea antimicrobica TaxID=561173 RepID=A0ABP7CDL1_9ACTN
MTLRLLALLALVAAFVVGTSTAARACDCADLAPAESMGHAEAVFTGTVVNVRAGAADPFGPRPPIVYTFRADNVYKGAAAAEFVVATNADSASCGYAFGKGGRYLVFADSDASGLVQKAPETVLSSSLCAGNVPVDPGSGPLRPGDERASGHESLAGPVDAELITALGAPTRVNAPSPGNAGAAGEPSGSAWGWIVAGAAVVVALVMTAALVVRRRRPAP